MFEGTKLWFSFCYFITAMLPAYMLLAVQLDFRINRFINYIIIFIIALIGSLIGKIIKQKLEQRCKEGQILINQEIIIKEKNGNVITFLFGVITPSLLLMSNASWVENIVITICIQLGCYFIIKHSSDIVPNILLIIFKINIYKIEDGKYLLTINKVLPKEKIKGDICRLGDSSLSNIYINK